METTGARLDGYAKEKPEGWSYYVAAKRDGSAIEGKLLLGLTSDELKMLDFWEGYDVSMGELLKRRDEIWELITHDRLEGFSRIARYRRVLERAVTDYDDDTGGNPMDALVYVQQ